MDVEQKIREVEEDMSSADRWEFSHQLRLMGQLGHMTFYSSSFKAVKELEKIRIVACLLPFARWREKVQVRAGSDQIGTLLGNCEIDPGTGYLIFPDSTAPPS